MSLQEADEWAERFASGNADGVFAGAQVSKAADGLSFPRAYSLALAPQLIHARSELLSQLVSSKAFRQIEFLAVGSFFIYRPASDPAASATLSRIPSTREDVFANKTIPARSKRALMKFLKFVLDFESESHAEIWKPKANDGLAGFLESEFKLDRDLQSYVITLTLSLDGRVSVADGLTAINRHLTSMGVFGTGFAAVYPKWGGLSEIAQVAAAPPRSVVPYTCSALAYLRCRPCRPRKVRITRSSRSHSPTTWSSSQEPSSRTRHHPQRTAPTFAVSPLLLNRVCRPCSKQSSKVPQHHASRSWPFLQDRSRGPTAQRRITLCTPLYIQVTPGSALVDKVSTAPLSLDPNFVLG